MSVENNVPEIRFKGFSGEWESFPLEEISDVLDGDRGHNYPNGEDLKEQGHTLFLSASNVTKNGFKLDVRQYITQDKSESLGNGKLIIDDIILTSRGSIGHIAWYNKNINQEVPFARINSGMLILRVKNYIDPGFISQYLKSPMGKKKIEVISFGSAQPQLTKASVSKFSVSIPSETPEQTQIGSYFQKLDNLINQHQKNHDKLRNIKKAMLEKMFPKQGETIPEIRFKGFSGEWEEIELSDEVTFINGRAYSQEELLEKGKYTVLRVGNFYTNSSWYYSDLELGDKYYADNGDLLYTWSASFGPHIWNGDKVIYHYHIWKLDLSESIDKFFLLHLLDYDRAKILSGSNGSTMIHITKSAMEAKKVFIPKKDEQIVLGNYFQKLDSLINQHQQQITKLTNIKQACLSKMFV